MSLMNRKRLRRLEAIVGSLDDSSADIPTGSIGTDELADDAATAAKVADDALTGTHVDAVADDATTPGIVVVHPIAITGGADASVDVTLDDKVRVIDAWVQLNGAGTAGSTVTLDDGTDAIATAIDVSSGGDKDIFRAAEIDDSKATVDAAGTLGATWVSTGGDCPAATLYALCVKVD